jgi:hypothetical protein
MSKAPPSARMRQLKESARLDLEANSKLADQKFPFPEYTPKTVKANLLIIAKAVGLKGLSDSDTKAEILIALDAAKAAH